MEIKQFSVAISSCSEVIILSDFDIQPVLLVNQQKSPNIFIFAIL